MHTARDEYIERYENLIYGQLRYCLAQSAISAGEDKNIHRGLMDVIYAEQEILLAGTFNRQDLINLGMDMEAISYDATTYSESGLYYLEVVNVCIDEYLKGEHLIPKEYSLTLLYDNIKNQTLSINMFLLKELLFENINGRSCEVDIFIDHLNIIKIVKCYMIYLSDLLDNQVAIITQCSNIDNIYVELKDTLHYLSPLIRDDILKFDLETLCDRLKYITNQKLVEKTIN